MSEFKLVAGAAAPTFSLLNQDEKEISLSETGDRVIVYFYPAASTPGCTTQACELRDNINALKAKGFSVLGISPDKPAKLKKFKDKENLNFELLSDPENLIAQAYGAFGKKSMYGKEYVGIIRSTFVVQEGKISHAFYNVKAKGHIDLLQAELGL
ncbi:thioredoxin-dependent thiol peroxidase [Candidatus Aquiluna sp. UB-MaderosW2red]|uniref:thioredoxin-dependent thiol peroxidase n=1 Tax=Candidatus Aquiluna sp. UB-MaderosW2red TaxID=1855377 RepID=UPI000875B6CC|nr:thioredoxin-dependent thiol peroxidase [Candidatus Aquiluna sp. UB-MaderosW2red]SCX14450.1 peroxiredoxin Q/BCP [Candidatus Aquiluna sp. UB-MaderosW2red]